MPQFLRKIFKIPRCLCKIGSVGKCVVCVVCDWKIPPTPRVLCGFLTYIKFFFTKKLPFL